LKIGMKIGKIVIFCVCFCYIFNRLSEMKIGSQFHP